jgi:hypothetical protein
MKAGDAAIRRRIARIVRDALAQGHSVEIDGLGEFVPDRAAGVRFVAQTKPRIFIAYVEEDLARARKLYRAFERYGLRPWMDKLKLMPGQNWPRAIENAIQTSDFFVACFSQRAAGKRGTFHSELRFALACAERVPLDEIFFIPIRLDGCSVPGRIARSFQYVDLFPDWEAGLGRVLEVIERQLRKRRRGLRLVS